MTFTLDNRNTSTLTADSRSANATFTQDSHSAGAYLWTSTIFPWLSTIQPWLISGGFPILSQDPRH